MFACFCVFKQNTANEMRISDGSSDVCSSDLLCSRPRASAYVALYAPPESPQAALPRSDFGPREFAMPQTIKIASWNINSVRARLDIVERFLQEKAPDILCLQETRSEERSVGKEFGSQVSSRRSQSHKKKKRNKKIP